MDLNDFRQKIPQLNGLDDQAALDLLHKHYYPDVDKQRMADVLGVKMPPPPVPERSMLRAAGDLGLQVAGGAVSGVRMMTDLAGADNAVSTGLRSAEDALRELQSAAAKGDQQEISRILKEAEGKGVLDQVIAGAKAFGQAPGALIANALGTSVPTLATALIPGVGQGAMAARLAAGAGIGAAQGAGNIKGVIYDEVMQNPLPGETPEQTKARAQNAQAYSGPNTGQILLGGGLGGLAGSTGMERTLAGLRNGVTQAAPGLASRVGMAAAAEAVPEIAQGGQEKMASNLALRNEGFDVDPMAGVAASATMEGLAGGITGGLAGIPNPPVQAKEPVPQPVRPPQPLPETGPMTRAVNAGLGPRITNTLTADLLGRSADPLAGQITAERQAAEDSALMRNQFADRNAASLAGGGLEGSRADPLANMLAEARTTDANAFTNVQQVANSRPPMPASDAARILEEAKARGMDMTAAPHPDGGFVVVPRQWVTPDMAAQAETEIADTLARMQQADAAPVERAERRRSEPVDLNLNTDPVAGYIEDLRNTNTPAARAYVGEFDAGRVTREDVEQRMQADRGLTADERLARAAAEGLRMNPKGDPFKTLMAANLASKTTPGTVIEVPGGYAIRTRSSSYADTQAQDAAPAEASVEPAGEAAPAVRSTGVPGVDQPQPLDALTDEQDAPQATTGAPATTGAATTEAEAAPVEAPAPARGDGAAAAGVPDAGAGAVVRSDGVATPESFKTLLNKKSTKVLNDDGRGRVLYDVDVPPAFRIKHFVNGRLPAVNGLELKEKASVTGNPSDKGYVLIDSRKQLESRKPAAPGAGDVQSDGVKEQPPIDPLGWSAKKMADAYDMEQMNQLHQYVLRNYSNPVIGGGPVENGRATTERFNAEGRKIHAAMQKAMQAIYDRKKAATDVSKNTPKMNTSAEPVQKTAKSEQVEPFDHAGLKIRQSRVKEGDQVVDRWVVQSPENAEREARGERQIGGDRIVETREQAIKTAEQEVKRYAKEKADRAEIDAQDKARRDADEAKKEANRGKTLLERRADAILDKPGKFPASAGLGLGTKREAMDKAIEQGRLVTEVMVDDTAAKKRDQDAVDAVRRAGYILGASNENIPVVKRGLEAQARLKEGKYQKPEYRVYQGSDRNGSFFEITKTEYDYVQKVKANPPTESKPDQETKAKAEPKAENLPEGWDTLKNGYTGLPVYRFNQGAGQPFAVVTRTEAGYEVQIRHGDKLVTSRNMRGYATGEALDIATQMLGEATMATHKDPGEKAEPATKAVVNESLKTAAKNEDTKPSEMRKWLLGEIDKALLQAPDRADYDEAVKRMGEKDAVSMFTGNGFLGKNAETGFVTFDVPGDGKFKVRNSTRGLLEFRKNVSASLGFKDSGQKTVKPEQNEGVRSGSGGQMAAIINMIEEGDFEAARDYAEAVGIKLEDVKVPRGERKPQWDQFLKDGTVPPPPDTRPLPPQRTPAQIAEDERLAKEAEAKKPKDTGWNMAGTGYGGKRYRGRNITTADGREIVARVYENAGNYDEVEVKVDGVRKFTVRDSYNAQDKADAFVKTLIEGEKPKADGVGRAVAGGQEGVNGYFYKGGQFLPSTMAEPGKWKVDGKWVKSGRALIGPREYGYQPTPFSRSLFELAGVGQFTQVTWDGRLAIQDGVRTNQGEPVTGDMTIRPGVKGVLGKEELTLQEIVDAWNNGQRWFDVKPDAETVTTQDDEPTIPEGYKPAGEPFYRGGKLTQGYAPFAPGERVTMKEAAGQSGVVESLASADESGVFSSAVVKFDNGVEQMVPLGKLQAAAAPAQTQATGTRRDPTKVSMFNPYEDGDIVTIDGQDWTVKQDTPGWYLTNTGNWRGTHPTIRNIKAMADLIRVVEQAAVAQPKPAGSTGIQAYMAASAEVTRLETALIDLRSDIRVKPKDRAEWLRKIGGLEREIAKAKVERDRLGKELRDGKAADPEAETPRLTPAEATELMEWQSLGTKDGVTKHILTFYESKANKDAKRGRMIVATVTKGDRSATAWMVDGDDQTFGPLSLAKKRGMEIGMAKAKTDGFVQMSALEQALGADVMSRPADKAAKLRNDADKLAAEARKMLAGIEPGQPIMSTRDRNLRERSMEKMRKAAELNAQADALDADTTAAPAQQEAKQATDDRDTFTLKRLNRETGRMEPVTFKRGEYVEVTLIGSDKKDYGEIDGISQARREFSVNGLWHTMAAAYKAERPAAPVRKDMAPLSSVIDKMNAKNGEGLTEADRVPEQKPASKTPTVDRHEALMKSVREGKATAEQFKAAFESLVANKDAVLAELETKTKAELLKAGGYFIQMRYASEKKGEVIDAIYRQMVSGFVLGDTLSYGMGKGAFEAAVRRHVEATDDAKLEQYAKDRKAAMEAAQAERAAKAAAMENPQTLADFKAIIAKHIGEGKSARDAFLALTPEQRIKYDTLAAESTKDEREARKRSAKTEVRAAGQATGGEIIATKHTRDGYDLFVVKLADRLSKEDYNTVLASAKRLGGWYSSFRGNGAIPGFQFKDKANAEAFLKLAGGDTADAQAQAEQRRDAFEDDRSQTAAERLRTMADKLTEQAAEIENAERKTNTARRARFAARALNGAAEMKAKASTMRNIAQALEDGKAKFLDAVRTKSQVDFLTGMVATAKNNELRAKYPSYADQEKRKGEPATAETADFAEFPVYTAFRSDLATLGRQMLEVDGAKKLGQRLMSVADDVSDAYMEFAKEPGNLFKLSTFSIKRGDEVKAAIFPNREQAERAISRSGLTGKAIVLAEKRGVNRIIMSPSEAINAGIWTGDGDKRITLSADFGAELVEAIGRRGNKANKLTVPWQFQNTYDRRKALSRMGIETASEYRSALREFIGLQERAIANKVREMELQMVGRKADGLDFFPTPAEIADQMIEAAEITPDMAVLEPSAGMGHIADRIREAGAEPDVIEISPERRELLQEKGYHLAETDDFMAMQPRKFFTYGDVFRAPDGTEGVMQGSGGMGSRRVVLKPLIDGVEVDYKRGQWYDRDELVGVRHRGSWSGYDRIIMNPPFSNRRDAEHVMHAYTLLKPGGRIVAIMGEGVFFGQDKKAQEFRDWLESVGGTSEKLPPGSFMDPSLPVNTGVSARMVVIDKPAGDVKFSVDDSTTPADTADYGPATQAHRDAAARLAESFADRIEAGGSHTDLLDAVAPGDGKRGQAAAAVANIARRLFRRQVVFVKFKGTPLFNGVVSKSVPGVIFLNIDSQKPLLSVLGHELLHEMAKSHPAMYANLSRRLDDLIKNETEYAVRTYNAYKKAGISTKGLDTREELEADIVGDNFMDAGFWQAMGESQPGLFRRIVNFVTKWLDNLSQKIADYRPFGTDEFLTDIAAARDAVASAMREFSGAEAGAVADPVDGDVRMSAATGYDRKAVQAKAKALGLPATGPTAEIANLVSIAEADPKTWTQQDFDAIKPYLSVHQDFGQNAEENEAKIMTEGLGRGMVDRLGEMDMNRGRTFAKGLTEKRAYVFVSGALKYLPGSPRLAPGNVPLFAVTPQPGKSIFETIKETARKPDGAKLSAAEKQDQTQTAAFKRWFAGSKVVDENGNPLVVYHGTRGSFTDFKPSKYDGGIYFTSDAGESGEFANMARNNGTTDGTNIIPVYLSMQNPSVIDVDGMLFDEDMDRLFKQSISAAKANGNDGLIVRNVDNLGGVVSDTYIAFRPEQIKSAIGNRGTFDPDNPDIRFSVVDDIKAAYADRVPMELQDRLADMTTSQRGFNRWWHGTVGTQLHKAKVNKEFGKVYYAVQDFMKDVSRMATLAADKAPDLLPQIDSLDDVKKVLPQIGIAGHRQRKADMKAASDALFDGTLRYTRDGYGQPVEAENETDAGIVWTDEELRDRGLNDEAIKLYRQARSAINQSLDNLMAADVYRMLTAANPESLADNPQEHAVLMAKIRKAAASDRPLKVLELAGVALDRQAEVLRKQVASLKKQMDEAYIDGMNEAYTQAKDALKTIEGLKERMEDKYERVSTLKSNGYAPLMRFGRYAVDVLDEDGNRAFFGLYETQYAANRAARRFAEQGFRVSQSVKSAKEFELLKGISPETAMLFAELLGVEKDEAMQKWLQNAVAEQSALKRQIRRKGIAGFDDDAGRVVAAFLTSNARAASRALHALRIQERVENVRAGDVKDEAIKLAEYVNNPQEEAQAIRSLLFINYIGGSVASALVNLTQTVVQTFPYLAQFGGARKGASRVTAAMRLAMGKIEDAELAQAVKRAEEDGVIKPQEVFQLQAEASRTLGSNLYARTGLALWGSFFQMAEQFNRRVAFIAAYQTAKEEGMRNPFAFAENAVDETQGTFNKGNRPNWGRGALGATLFTFKTFTIQYVEFLKRLPPKERALALGVLVLLAGFRGLPFAEDAEDVVDTVAQSLGYNFTTKEQMDRFLVATLGKPFADFLQHGASGTGLLPFDVSQRLGMADLLPATGVLKPSETRKDEQILEVFGVTGDFLRDGLKKTWTPTSVAELSNTAWAPVAIRNAAKAIEMYDRGIYTDSRGRKVMDVGPVDAAMKGIGLQPAGVAEESRKAGSVYEMRALFAKTKAEITEQMALGQFENDKAKIQKARERLADWNAKNPEAQIVLSGQAVRRRVTEMRKDRADRLVRSTPRELRAQAAETME